MLGLPAFQHTTWLAAAALAPAQKQCGLDSEGISADGWQHGRIIDITVPVAKGLPVFDSPSGLPRCVGGAGVISQGCWNAAAICLRTHNNHNQGRAVQSAASCTHLEQRSKEAQPTHPHHDAVPTSVELPHEQLYCAWSHTILASTGTGAHWRHALRMGMGSRVPMCILELILARMWMHQLTSFRAGLASSHWT